MDEKRDELDLSVARDHAEHPRNYGMLENANGHSLIKGQCGDSMEFWLRIDDGKLAGISFITDGCGSSLACGSMATVLAAGRTIEEALILEKDEILEALGGLPPEVEHCAELAANTVQAACWDYFSRLDRPGEKSGNREMIERREGESEEQYLERLQLTSRLGCIRNKIVVLSGKGGVGKSTVAVNIAVSLMAAGMKVGLLDVDIHGPSIPTMLGLEGESIMGSSEGMLPVEQDGLKVMSLGFLLESQDEAVIWRGPRKTGVIKQFLKDVAWGDLDYLIIDSPPGTGDEPLSVCQLIDDLTGAVVVTTPQKVAAVDVRKSISFCRELKIPVIGVIENMSGFVCPGCGQVTRILRSGGGRMVADGMDVPFLGEIPMDPGIAEASDLGRAFVKHLGQGPALEKMKMISEVLLNLDTKTKDQGAL